MSKQVPKGDIKASRGRSADEGKARLGPSPEGARGARAIALGMLLGILLWTLIGVAIWLLF